MSQSLRRSRCLRENIRPRSSRAPKLSPHSYRAFSLGSPRFDKHQQQQQQEQQQENRQNEPFGTRLRAALRKTRIEWYTIPVFAGIGFLGATHLYKVTQREKARQEEEDRLSVYSDGGDQEPGRPKKRRRIRPSGPWSVSFSR
jgi:phosphatidylserine decarboxylase